MGHAATYNSSVLTLPGEWWDHRRRAERGALKYRDPPCAVSDYVERGTVGVSAAGRGYLDSERLRENPLALPSKGRKGAKSTKEGV